MEIVNRIKLLMEYDMKHTLSENVEIISEIQIPGIGNIARNYIDDIFKSGKKFKTVIGTEIKSADELINSLKSMGDDALNSVGKTHIQQTLIKNPALQLSSKQKLINNMVSNPNVIKKYSKDSYDIILQKFKNAGYPDDVAETIAKKLKPKTATPKPNTGSKISTPKLTGSLSQEAESIFLAAGKRMTSSQAQLLNDLAQKMNKLSKSEFIQLDSELRKLNLGTVNQVINRLRAADDELSKIKLEKFKNLMKKSTEYLNAAATGVRGVFNKNTLYAIICILLAFTTIGAISDIKNIPILGPLLSRWLSSGVEKVGDKLTPGETPDDNTPPDDETTPDNNLPLETW